MVLQKSKEPISRYIHISQKSKESVASLRFFHEDHQFNEGSFDSENFHKNWNQSFFDFQSSRKTQTGVY
jgi:hypothetical protein